MELSDIKVGMILTDTGPGSIRLYHDNACTDPTDSYIKPGQVIGQVVEVIPGTQTVVFTDPSTTGNFQQASGPITDAATIPEKIASYSLSWLVNDARASAGVKFSDLQANVSDAQVQKAQAILDANDASGGIAPYVKKIAQGASETASAAASGLFGGGFGWWAAGLGLIWLASKSKTVKNL